MSSLQEHLKQRGLEKEYYVCSGKPFLFDLIDSGFAVNEIILQIKQKKHKVLGFLNPVVVHIEVFHGILRSLVIHDENFGWVKQVLEQE